MSRFLLVGVSGRWGLEPLLLPEHVGGFPSPVVPGWQPMALLSPACAYKRASLSVTSCSVPYLAPQVQLVCEQNPREVTASASPHVWNFGTLKLHLHCLICFLKTQKWDSSVNRMWGGKGRMLIWAGSCHWGRQSTRGSTWLWSTSLILTVPF